jgi:hypothetical protein
MQSCIARPNCESSEFPFANPIVLFTLIITAIRKLFEMLLSETAHIYSLILFVNLHPHANGLTHVLERHRERAGKAILQPYRERQFRLTAPLSKSMPRRVISFEAC